MPKNLIIGYGGSPDQPPDPTPPPQPNPTPNGPAAEELDHNGNVVHRNQATGAIMFRISPDGTRLDGSSREAMPDLKELNKNNLFKRRDGRR